MTMVLVRGIYLPVKYQAELLKQKYFNFEGAAIINSYKLAGNLFQTDKEYPGNNSGI